MAITVNMLMKACAEQVKKGNGDKKIYLSDDDEGNGYHEMYFLFTDELNEIKECNELTLFVEEDELKDIVILG